MMQLNRSGAATQPCLTLLEMVNQSARESVVDVDTAGCVCVHICSSTRTILGGIPMEWRMCHRQSRSTESNVALRSMKDIKSAWSFRNLRAFSASKSNGGDVIRCWPSTHEACLMGSAVMMHGRDHSVDDDPGNCFARYWEDRDAAAVRAWFTEGKEYSLHQGSALLTKHGWRFWRATSRQPRHHCLTVQFGCDGTDARCTHIL